ncbi:MAG: hypothetical protein JWM32_576 [Verrucomicrobia bacterium]|nr:hypothetical protein [Verrucomicrobiota bacterium]
MTRLLPLAISTEHDQSSLPSTISFKVLHSFEGAEPFRKEWNDVVASSKADVYQTFEWSATWWKFYGNGRHLHILLGYEKDDLVGVIPFFTERRWLGPIWLRTAKLVGCDHSLSLCNLAVPAEFIRPFIAESVRIFLGKENCDVLLFGPLSGAHSGIDDIKSEAEDMPQVGEMKLHGNACNTYFELPATFEEYLKTLDKKQRSNFKRMMEQSSKMHRIEFDTVSDPQKVGAVFEEFCVQHEDQWRRDGKLGHFGDWPNSKSFNRELIQTLASQRMVRFYRILADDKVISSQYCFVFGETIYWRLPARVRSTEWDRFSLGTLGLVKMIESLIGEKVRTVEGGRGHYPYKLHHGGREYPAKTVQLTRRGLSPSIRRRLFGRAARVVNFGYYRLLFLRLAPRFPILQASLWTFWIRSTCE